MTDNCGNNEHNTNMGMKLRSPSNEDNFCGHAFDTILFSCLSTANLWRIIASLPLYLRRSERF
jgi:hypothetical protein